MFIDVSKFQRVRLKFQLCSVNRLQAESLLTAVLSSINRLSCHHGSSETCYMRDGCLCDVLALGYRSRTT